jgi:hypothetical protein
MSQRSTTYYAVIREMGENWDARLPMRQQEHWDEHAAFMNALADDPWTPLGLLRIAKVERWEILLSASNKSK